MRMVASDPFTIGLDGLMIISGGKSFSVETDPALPIIGMRRPLIYCMWALKNGVLLHPYIEGGREWRLVVRHKNWMNTTHYNVFSSPGIRCLYLIIGAT